jgi:homoserine kinase
MSLVEAGPVFGSAEGFSGPGRLPEPSAPKNTLHLRLPATSANLGPGFDTLGLALTLALEIDATPAREFSLKATGRNTDVCSSLRRNLMLDVYQKTLAAGGAPLVPLSLDIHNEIPIGMGCGSSAAVRLAGIALANHFGNLGWSRERILTEASLLEGHPDNAAACWLGGMTVATLDQGQVDALKIVPPVSWRILLVMPEKPLATVAARSVLPASYSREDAVYNIQRASLLTAAFAAGRGDLLQAAMQDRLHQPFRNQICPLLPRLSPLAGRDGVLGVALSGAGPAVLVVVDENSAIADVRRLILEQAGLDQTGLDQAGLDQTASSIPVELLECRIETSPAVVLATSGK